MSSNSFRFLQMSSNCYWNRAGSGLLVPPNQNVFKFNFFKLALIKTYLGNKGKFHLHSDVETKLDKINWTLSRILRYW